MAALSRQDTVIRRADSYSSKLDSDRALGLVVPRRVPFRWFSSLRNWYSPDRRQTLKGRLQEWAKRNCFTLIFVLILFILTWLWILVVVTFYDGGIRGG